MRSRQHVVICRLNDEEYHIYKQILSRALRSHSRLTNKSEEFRAALEVMRQYILDENELIWMNKVSDFR